MKQKWSREDLIELWELSPADMGVISSALIR